MGSNPAKAYPIYHRDEIDELTLTSVSSRVLLSMTCVAKTSVSYLFVCLVFEPIVVVVSWLKDFDFFLIELSFSFEIV